MDEFKDATHRCANRYRRFGIRGTSKANNLSKLIGKATWTRYFASIFHVKMIIWEYNRGEE
jgi:hypothetical protein